MTSIVLDRVLTCGMESPWVFWRFDRLKKQTRNDVAGVCRYPGCFRNRMPSLLCSEPDSLGPKNRPTTL